MPVPIPVGPSEGGLLLREPRRERRPLPLVVLPPPLASFPETSVAALPLLPLASLLLFRSWPPRPRLLPELRLRSPLLSRP